jgi:hypothetical protein
LLILLKKSTGEQKMGGELGYGIGGIDRGDVPRQKNLLQLELLLELAVLLLSQKNTELEARRARRRLLQLALLQVVLLLELLLEPVLLLRLLRHD